MKLLIDNPDINFTNFDYHGDKNNPHGVMIIKRGFRYNQEKGWQKQTDLSQLFEEEVYLGDIASSSLFRESEYVPFKPFVDVIIHAHAHAPNGKPAKHLTCSIEYKNKVIWQAEIHGERYWEDKGVLGARWTLSEAKEITTLPLIYEYAYGGTCFWLDNDEEISESFAYNPAGLGFMNKQALKQQKKPYKAPQILALGQVPKSPLDELKAVGCAPLAKTWQPRLSYSGTFDEAWKKELWPHMPGDFDNRFWNGAYPSLQLPLDMDKKEPFILKNMSELGDLNLSVNKKEFFAIITDKRTGEASSEKFNLDTIYLNANDADNITVEYIWRLKTIASEYIQQFEIKDEING